MIGIYCMKKFSVKEKNVTVPCSPTCKHLWTVTRGKGKVRGAEVTREEIADEDLLTLSDKQGNDVLHPGWARQHQTT